MKVHEKYRVTVAAPFPIFTGFPWHLNMRKNNDIKIIIEMHGKARKK